MNCFRMDAVECVIIQNVCTMRERQHLKMFSQIIHKKLALSS